MIISRERVFMNTTNMFSILRSFHTTLNKYATFTERSASNCRHCMQLKS
jgi:hypothetical protein